MQLPNEKTRVSKCVDLAEHAARMLGKFTSNAVLVELAARMKAAGDGLHREQQVYESTVRALLPTRVDVRYADFIADRVVKRVERLAELADERKAVRTQVLPDGARAVIRLRGASQVQAMEDLEGKLRAALPSWPDAAAALAEVTQHREQYEAALQSRSAAGQASRDQRALRDAEKQRFLSTYAEIAALVQAQFPRDKEMQDLFFDEVRSRSTGEVADGDEEVPEEEGAAPTPS